MYKYLKPLVIGDLTIEIPIIQGGMGVMVSTSSLASAVANCGAAGTIASVGLGYGTAENESDYISASRKGLQREIRKARELTDGVFGVNIMVALTNYEDLARTASQEGVDFIVSGAGLPMKLPQFVEDPHIKLIPIVSSTRALTVIARTWAKRYQRYPDAVVVEGPKAGGHLGFHKDEVVYEDEDMLEELVKDVITEAGVIGQQAGRNIPVIAAGGIYTGADAAKFFRMGAGAVQVATRFVATPECSVPDRFKEIYLKATDDDVIIIDSPVGMPGRAIRTPLFKKVDDGIRIPIKCNYHCLKTCNPKTVPYCIARALFNAVAGDIEHAVIFAGENVTRIDKIVPVKEIIDEIASEADRELSRG